MNENTNPEVKSVQEILDDKDAQRHQGAPQPSESAPERGSGPQQSDSAGDGSPDRDHGGAHFTYAALKDERSKRQAIQRRNAELEQQLQAFQTAQHETESSRQSGDFWSNPEEHFGRLASSVVQTVMRASKAEAIAEHGREAYAQMNEALGQAIARNDPDLPALRDACITSDDPSGVAMRWYVQTQQTQRQPSRAPVMPSNFAGARNVGSRSGPAWNGPKSLDDIFKR